MDPDYNDKIKAEVEYLDEMIKGEIVNIQKLNNKYKSMKKLTLCNAK